MQSSLNTYYLTKKESYAKMRERHNIQINEGVKMKNILKNSIIIITMVFIIFCTLGIYSNIYANSYNEELTYENLEKLPKDSMERYAFSNAIKNNTSYHEELQKEKSSIVVFASPEYVTYKTKTVKLAEIEQGVGTYVLHITTNAKVLADRRNNRVIQVLDFGNPYISVDHDNATWNTNAISVHRESSLSARFSTTGQLFIQHAQISIGGVTMPNIEKSKVLTLNKVIRW